MNDTDMMAMLHNRRYLVTVAHVLLLNSRHSVISVNVFFSYYCQTISEGHICLQLFYVIV